MCVCRCVSTYMCVLVHLFHKDKIALAWEVSVSARTHFFIYDENQHFQNDFHSHETLFACQPIENCNAAKNEPTRNGILLNELWMGGRLWRTLYQFPGGWLEDDALNHQRRYQYHLDASEIWQITTFYKQKGNTAKWRCFRYSNPFDSCASLSCIQRNCVLTACNVSII